MRISENGVKVFERGDRVIRIETGETGVVRFQYVDGYVALDLDGWPAELMASSLKEMDPSPSNDPGTPPSQR